MHFSYPIAMSVRSTNVYEERSLGVFGDELEEEPEDSKPGAEAVAKYLGFHARRQLAFGEWQTRMGCCKILIDRE